jgi:hypothetical protein
MNLTPDFGQAPVDLATTLLPTLGVLPARGPDLVLPSAL